MARLYCMECHTVVGESVGGWQGDTGWRGSDSVRPAVSTGVPLGSGLELGHAKCGPAPVATQPEAPDAVGGLSHSVTRRAGRSRGGLVSTAVESPTRVQSRQESGLDSGPHERRGRGQCQARQRSPASPASPASNEGTRGTSNGHQLTEATHDRGTPFGCVAPADADPDCVASPESRCRCTLRLLRRVALGRPRPTLRDLRHPLASSPPSAQSPGAPRPGGPTTGPPASGASPSPAPAARVSRQDPRRTARP